MTLTAPTDSQSGDDACQCGGRGVLLPSQRRTARHWVVVRFGWQRRELTGGKVKLNEEAVAQALFRNEKVRNRIATDYGLENPADSPLEFVDQVVHSFDQAPSPDPLAPLPNATVFEAAVLALASNSRSWATFLKTKSQLYDVLGGLELAEARDATPATLAKFLTGSTGNSDAGAIVKWAKLLSDLDDKGVNYYDGVIALADWIKDRATAAGIADLPNEHLMLCLVGHLMDEPPKRWAGPRVGKLNGMRFALGSEFFRNLGWNGFKPDRHVIRLLDCWAPELVKQQEGIANRLAPLTGRKSAEIGQMMRYSLAGIAISSSENYSRTDNLIWLLGANVETKRKGCPERDARYVTL